MCIIEASFELAYDPGERLPVRLWRVILGEERLFRIGQGWGDPMVLPQPLPLGSIQGAARWRQRVSRCTVC